LLKFLKKQQASNRNLLFASTIAINSSMPSTLKWQGAVPFTVLINPERNDRLSEDGTLIAGHQTCDCKVADAIEQ